MNSLTCKDCVEGMSQLDTGSVDLVFADPPFNIKFEYDTYDDDRPAEEYLAWCRQWIAQIYRVLKPGGSFWLAIGERFVSELDMACKRNRFHKRRQIAWHFTFGVNETRNFTSSHTHLLYFVKDKQNFTFNATQIRVPSARALEYNDKRAHPDGRLPDDTWIIRPKQLPNGFPADGDLWSISRVAGTFKQRAEGASTQMPEQLLGRIIRACSNPGDLVLDPMGGSFTTAAVAKKLGRRYTSYDISEAYVAAGLKRLRGAREGDPLDGPIPQGG